MKLSADEQCDLATHIIEIEPGPMYADQPVTVECTQPGVWSSTAVNCVEGEFKITQNSRRKTMLVAIPMGCRNGLG